MILNKEKIENFFIFSLLFVSPLVLGSVHKWAYYIIALASLVLFHLRFNNDEENGIREVSLPPMIRGVLLLGITAISIYMIPLPGKMVKMLNPAVFALREKYMIDPDPAGWQPLSIYIRASADILIKAVTFAMLFTVIFSKIKKIPGKNKTVFEKTVKGESFFYTDFIILCGLCSILSIMFHSLCDFNLHIPANVLYFTIILSVVTGLLELRNDKSAINRRFLDKLLNVIISSGFIIAVFGIIQKLGWNGKLYWIIKKDRWTGFGPYVSYNHFAGLMELCSFISISGLISGIFYSPLKHIRGIKNRILWFSTAEANKTLLYLFTSVVIIAALFMTTSRGGIVSFILSFMLFYLFMFITFGRRQKYKILISLFLVLGFVLIMVLWIGPDPVIDKFHKLKYIIKEPVLNNIRPIMWKDSIRIISDFPLLGTGPGTFSYIYPKYRTFIFHMYFARYLENDYLQCIVEMGLAGWGIICISLFILAGMVRKFLIGTKPKGARHAYSISHYEKIS